MPASLTTPAREERNLAEGSVREISILGASTQGVSFQRALLELRTLEEEIKFLRGKLMKLREEINKSLRDSAGGPMLFAWGGGSLSEHGSTMNERIFSGVAHPSGPSSASGEKQSVTLSSSATPSIPSGSALSVHGLSVSDRGRAEKLNGNSGGSSAHYSSKLSSKDESSGEFNGAANAGVQSRSSHAAFLYGEGAQGDTLEVLRHSASSPFAYGSAPNSPFAYGSAHSTPPLSSTEDFVPQYSSSESESDSESEKEDEISHRRSTVGGHSTNSTGHVAAHTPFRTSFSFFPAYDLEARAQEQLDRGTEAAAKAVARAGMPRSMVTGKAQHGAQGTKVKDSATEAIRDTQANTPGKQTRGPRKRGSPGAKPGATSPGNDGEASGGGRYRWWL